MSKEEKSKCCGAKPIFRPNASGHNELCSKCKKWFEPKVQSEEKNKAEFGINCDTDKFSPQEPSSGSWEEKLKRMLIEFSAEDDFMSREKFAEFCIYNIKPLISQAEEKAYEKGWQEASDEAQKYINAERVKHIQDLEKAREKVVEEMVGKIKHLCNKRKTEVGLNQGLRELITNLTSQGE